MHFIQTLSFGRGTNALKHRFGWICAEYHLMGWALSCLQLDKIYGRIDLCCCNNGARILIDKIDLPYKSVKSTHDQFLLPDSNLWALPKIYTYSLQEEPFIHFDGDVFIFNELPKSFLTSGLIAQNVEQASDFYFSTQKQII